MILQKLKYNKKKPIYKNVLKDEEKSLKKCAPLSHLPNTPKKQQN